MAEARSNSEFKAFVEETSAQVEAGAFADALEAAQAAADRWPEAFWPRYLLGRSLEGLGRGDEALGPYRTAVEQHPDHPRAPLARAGIERINDDPGGSDDRPHAPPPRPALAPAAQRLYVPTSRGAKTGEYEIRRRPSAKGRTPVPPPELMEYGEQPDFHLQSGSAHVEEMLTALDACGFSWESCDRVLEFGCSNGRMLRWLSDRASDREMWGVDVQSDQILWAAENLSPPLNFATTTTAPYLPFPDRHFDLIFAGSVFTHLGELHASWMLELARILSPRGFLYLTLHDETFMRVVLADRGTRFRPIADHIRASGYHEELRDGDFDFISTAPYGDMLLSQVMISSRYLRELTRPYLRIVDKFPRAYSQAQTAFVLAPKPRRGQRRRGGAARAP